MRIVGKYKMLSIFVFSPEEYEAYKITGEAPDRSFCAAAALDDLAGAILDAELMVTNRPVGTTIH